MEEEDDVIIREMPVYLSKQLADQLYLYQYPVRPPDKKLDQSIIRSCSIKPNHKEVKLEIELNVDSNNFNLAKAEDIALNTDGASGYRDNENDVFFENNIMDKQCYSSSKAVEDCSKYAVGVVHGNEIHLTPLHGIIQLRPSFPHLDRTDKRARDTEKAATMDVDEVVDDAPQVQQVTVKFARTENERARKLREKSFNYLSKKIAEEPWCHTKWHHPQSDAAELERMKLLSESQDNVGTALNMSKKNYIRMLIPPDKEEAAVLPPLPSHVLSLSALKSLPLLEQCRLLLQNAKIITFQQLLLLLAGEGLNVETVLRTLPQVATVIRGCWVVLSDVLYPKDTYSSISGVPAHIMCRARDYVLYLFTQKQYVDRRKVSSVIKLPAEETKEIFTGIARLRHNKGWELLLPTDHAFIEKYPDVVQRQQLFWEAKLKQLNEFVSDSKQGRQRRKSKSASEDVKLPNGVKRERPVDSDSEKRQPPAKKTRTLSKSDSKIIEKTEV